MQVLQVVPASACDVPGSDGEHHGIDRAQRRREDRWRAAPVLLSMPVTRKAVVRAKYLFLHATSDLDLYTLIFSLALAAIPMIVEYKYETNATFLSLPVSRLEVVAARYGYSIMAVLVAVLLSFGILMLLVRGLHIHAEIWSRWLDIRVFTGLGVMALFYVFLYLPFHFRYGPGKAVLVCTFLAVAVSLAVLLWMRFRLPVWDAVQVAKAIREWMVVPALAAFVGVLLLGWIPASVAISVRSYQKREF